MPAANEDPVGPKAVPVAKGPQLVTINCGQTFLVAGTGGEIGSGQLTTGLYHADTRFISGYRMELNGKPLEPISSSQLAFWRARWELIGSARRVDEGAADADGTVTVTLDRHLSQGRMHDDLTVHRWGRQPVELLLTIALESDFADLFEVRTRRWQRRTHLVTAWDSSQTLETSYRRGDFVRRHRVRFHPHVAGASYGNGALRFPIDLRERQAWRICLQHDLIDRLGARPVLVPCPGTAGPASDAGARHRRWVRGSARLSAADPRLQRAYERSIQDFGSLRMFEFDLGPDLWVPAAGVPWFVALFGRDSLIAAQQALIVDPRIALATLTRLGELQAAAEDPFRDAEPGKILHELRRGEWAHFRVVPHSPYYGTADATSLYLMLLGESWRWGVDAATLRPLADVARRCLSWIDHHGDRDGDGIQEYAPLAPGNYRNQSWRDAEDGVLDEEGGLPALPLATCELQAYAYEAKLQMADLFAAWGERNLARQLRRQAKLLRQKIKDLFWDPERQLLAMAVDGAKQRILTASSNPGHCLWLGVLDENEARLAADRLMLTDLFCGWGLRTLSSAHPSFDPHSYQRGSVWPHDTVIAAAGLRRYGRVEQSWQLLDGILAAAAAFEGSQLPELFAGLERQALDVPVPYRQANVPQAWAAGSVFQAVRVLLGLHPDVPSGKLYIDPRLPTWCPELELHDVRLGPGRVSIKAHRGRDGRSQADVRFRGVHLEVVQGPPRGHHL